MTQGQTKDLPRTAILIPTCDRYRDICTLGIAWLQEYWHEPPPIYVCGINELPGHTVLTYSSDPRNWIGIVHEALLQLEADGIEFLYLILDDHPPVSCCNEVFLNRDLPAKARALQAGWVSLAGWDQFREAKGEVLGCGDFKMMHNDADFTWNMNLHPGLWCLNTMKRLLGEVLKQHPSGGSARDFESIVKTIHYTASAADRRALYRISGDYSACVDRWFKRPLTRKIIRSLIHCARFSMKTVSPVMLDKTDRRLKPYTEYLNGAYPMIWSGLMRNGTANETVPKFMKLSGNSAYLESLSKVDGL